MKKKLKCELSYQIPRLLPFGLFSYNYYSVEFDADSEEEARTIADKKWDEVVNSYPKWRRRDLLEIPPTLTMTESKTLQFET